MRDRWLPGPLATARRVASAHPDASLLLLVLLLAAGARLAFSPLAPLFLHGDSYQYFRPAAGLVDGDGFPLPLKRPPAYPVFLFLVARALGEDPGLLAAAQHLLGVGTAGLVFGVGRLCLGRTAGLVGGLAAALSGGLLVFEHYMLTEALFTFLLTLAVLLYLVGLRRGGVLWYVGSGVVVGLAILTRVHAQILLLLAPVAVVLYCRRWCPAVRGTLVACLAAACVLVPWMIRNQVVHGDFTVAARSGQSLIYMTLVHHPGRFVFYDPDDPPPDDDDTLERARRYIQQQANIKARNPSANVLGINIHAWLMRNLDLTEAEANAIMQRVAVDAIRARPLVYAQVVLEEAAEVFRTRRERMADHLASHRRTLTTSDNPPPRRIRPFIQTVSPEHERALGLSEFLVGTYQGPALGPVVPVLFLVGLLAAAAVPAWRLALVPGLVVASLLGVGIVVVGFAERYGIPTDPLMHVVAVAGVFGIVRAISDLVARARRAAAPEGGETMGGEAPPLRRTVVP